MILEYSDTVTEAEHEWELEFINVTTFLVLMDEL